MSRKLRIVRSAPIFETLESRSLLSATGMAVASRAAASTEVGTGLTGEYFAGNDFQQPVLVRSDATINFPSGYRPDPSLAKGAFSVKWTGQVEPLFTQTYTFSTQTGGGVSLSVNGQPLINSTTVQTRQNNSATIALTAGQKYDIEMDYTFSGSGSPLARLLWSSASQHKRAIQKTALFPDANVALPAGTGLIGEYFLGENFQQQVLTRNDPVINFPFNHRTPDPVIPQGPFSIMEIGQITPSYSETYTFYTRADDGVRLLINGQVVVNDYTRHPARTREGTITLQADVPYSFLVEYYEDNIPPASLQVSWSSPSTPKQVIPASAFTNLGELSAGAVQVTGTTAGEIDLAWAGSLAATGYIVQRSSDGTTGWTQIGTTAAGTTAFDDTGLPPDTTYFYRIIATDASGNSNPDNPVSGTTLTSSVPAAPTNLTVLPTSDTTVTLNWNDVAGETGFTVESSPDGLSSWTTTATVGAGVVTLNIGGLTSSTTYDYRVIATNGSGSSAPSNVANVSTDAAFPSYATLTTIYGLGGSNIYTIDTTTGAAAPIGTILFSTAAAARDPVTGNFFYISTDPSNVQIATWNPTASAGSANTIVNSSIAVTGLVERAAFRADGMLFFNANLGDLYAYDTTTNAAVALGTVKAGGSPLAGNDGDMAFGPDGNLYEEAGSMMYEVNASDISAAGGAGSTIPATLLGATGTSNLQIAFGQNGELFGYDANGQIYSVSLSTGAATAIPGSIPSGIGMGDLASVPLYADLAVNQTASTLTGGSDGTYTLTVVNNGPDATIRPITVTDTLPAGLSFVSGAGSGWTFNVQGQTVTLIYADNVAANTTLPTVTLTVAVSNSAPASVVNTAVVSTTIFDQNTSNNTSMLMSAVGT